MAKKETRNPTSDFLAKVRNTPNIKSQEYEATLAYCWLEDGNVEARNELVNAHLKLAMKIARKYTGYGHDINDLMAVAGEGLMKAVDKFDPEKGFRFATYAQWWVRASLQTYVYDNFSMVKTRGTQDAKKLFFKYRQERANLERTKGQIIENEIPEDMIEEFAQELGVSADEIRLFEKVMHGDASLNTKISRNGDEGSAEWIDMLEDDNASAEAQISAQELSQLRHQFISAALGKLKDRERDILIQRRLVDKDDIKTLEELSDVYGVSRERIRQLEVKAVSKLEAEITKLARNKGMMAQDLLP